MARSLADIMADAPEVSQGALERPKPRSLSQIMADAPEMDGALPPNRMDSLDNILRDMDEKTARDYENSLTGGLAFGQKPETYLRNAEQMEQVISDSPYHKQTRDEAKKFYQAISNLHFGVGPEATDAEDFSTLEIREIARVYHKRGLITDEELDKALTDEAPASTFFNPEGGYTREHLPAPKYFYDKSWVERAKEAPQSIAGGVNHSISGFFRGVEWLQGEAGVNVGAKGVAQWFEENAGVATRGVRADFTTDLWGAVGSMMTLVVPAGAVGAVGRMAGLARGWALALEMGTASTAEALIEAGGTYNNIINKGGSIEEAQDGARFSFGSNLALLLVSNKLGIYSARYAALRRGVKPQGAIIKGTKAGAAGFVGEFTQEAGQSVIGQIAEGEEISWAEAAYNGFIGGIVGAGTSVLMATAAQKIEGIPELQPETQKLYQDTMNQALLTGVTQEAANITATQAIAETEDGAKVIRKTMEAQEAVMQAEAAMGEDVAVPGAIQDIDYLEEYARIQSGEITEAEAEAEIWQRMSAPPEAPGVAPKGIAPPNVSLPEPLPISPAIDELTDITQMRDSTPLDLQWLRAPREKAIELVNETKNDNPGQPRALYRAASKEAKTRGAEGVLPYNRNYTTKDPKSGADLNGIFFFTGLNDAIKHAKEKYGKDYQNIAEIQALPLAFLPEQVMTKNITPKGNLNTAVIMLPGDVNLASLQIKDLTGFKEGDIFEIRRPDDTSQRQRITRDTTRGRDIGGIAEPGLPGAEPTRPAGREGIPGDIRRGGEGGPTDLPGRLGEAGLLDLNSEVSLAPILTRLKSFTDNPAQGITDLTSIGRSIWAEGKTAFNNFTTRMQEVLGDLWADFKDFARQAWEIVANERGEITLTPEGKPASEVEGDPATREAIRTALQAVRKATAATKVEVAKTEGARVREIFEAARGKRDVTARRQQLRKAIKKELRTTKPKKQAGKPVGQFTPEIQRVLDQFRQAASMSTTEALAKINENMAQYTDDLPPDNIVIENRIISMTHDFGTRTVPQLEILLADIKALKDEGKMISELRKFNRQAQIEKDVAEALFVLTGGQGLPEGADARTRKANYDRMQGMPDRAKQWMASQGKTIVGWKDILDILSRLDKTSKPFESNLSEIGDVLDAKNVEKDGVRTYMDRMQAMYREAFGISLDWAGNREMMNRMRADSELIDLGMFFDLVGRRVPLEISKAEARKRYMEFQDTTLDATFTEGMAYTPEMKRAIMEQLSPEDIAFAEAQMAFYREYYEGINEVYRDLYGIDLPQNPNYSPVRREGFGRDAGIGFGVFLEELNMRASAAPGGVITRTDNILPIKPISDIAALEQHMSEMEHFKAWAQRTKDLRAVFDNTEVRAAIETFHDPKILGVIENFIADFTRGGVDTSKNMDILDKWRVNMARSVLAIKPSIGIKQLTSFIAYADAMPVDQFVKYSLEFWKNPIENGKMLKRDSTLLRERGEHMDRDVRDAQRTDEFRAFRLNPSFMNSLMLNIKAGDQGAIMAGGWPLYKYHRDLGKSHEEAIRIFEQVTESTQQSADLSELSVWQRGNSFAKLFTTYKSSPNQYFRKEQAAIRNLIHGRQGVGQTAKTVVIFHMLLPMFFQWVSDGFEWDEDEQLRAMVLGPLNGIFIAGDLIEAAVRSAVGLRDFDDELPMMSVADGVIRSIGLLKDDDITTEDFMRTVRAGAETAGHVTGLPLKAGIDIGTGAVDLFSGDFEKGAYQVLGWSPYVAKKASKDDKKKTRRRR